MGLTPQTFFVVWRLNGDFLYYDEAGVGDPNDRALALNDGNIAVGQVASTVAEPEAYAAVFGPNFDISELQPPKNTSWAGTATGINEAGVIVSYGMFPNETVGRALRFFPNQHAVVIPVGGPGVSTSAQAVNVHGDIVGNAGSQAYLYKNDRVTYLPRPPGENAGNAVAYAVNASDEVVGNIYTGPNTSTAFLYADGRSYDLTSLLPAKSGWQIVSAVGINDSEQIVGNGYKAMSAFGGSYSMQPQPPSNSPALRARRF